MPGQKLHTDKDLRSYEHGATWADTIVTNKC